MSMLSVLNAVWQPSSSCYLQVVPGACAQTAQLAEVQMSISEPQHHGLVEAPATTTMYECCEPVAMKPSCNSDELMVTICVGSPAPQAPSSCPQHPFLVPCPSPMPPLSPPFPSAAPLFPTPYSPLAPFQLTLPVHCLQTLMPPKTLSSFHSPTCPTPTKKWGLSCCNAA